MLSYDTPKKIKGILTRLNNYIVEEKLVEKQFSNRKYQQHSIKLGVKMKHMQYIFMTWIKNWKAQLQN